MAFTHYLPVTVQAGQVPSPQTDFPWLVSYVDARLKSTANGGHVASASGFDIRPYATVGGTALPFELEAYDPATGTLVLWVLVPTLTVGTTIYLYYGDPALTTSGATAIWDGTWGAVWHANPDLGLLADSGPYGYPLVSVGSTPPAPGRIQGGIELPDPGADAFGNLLQTANNSNILDLTSQPFTIAWWFKPMSLSNPSGNHVPLFKGAYQDEGFYCAIDSAGSLTFVTNQPGALQATSTDAGQVAVGVFAHLVIQRSGVAVRIFVNGVDQTLSAGTHVDPTSSNYLFDWGTYANGYPALAAPGIYDEMRVSFVTRSADWILTDYRNQSAPSTFAALGTEVAIGTPLTTTTRVTQARVELLSQPVLPTARLTQALVETLQPVVAPTATRVSQAVLEALSLPVLPAARITQQLVELLSLNPETRVSQAALELLSLPQLPAAQVTQALIEILAGVAPASPDTRVTQQLVELLQQVAPPPPPIDTRVSQAPVETLSLPLLPASLVTQALVEILQATVAPPPDTRVTQALIELLQRSPRPAAQVTQALVELLTQGARPVVPPCTSGGFPIDDVPGGGGGGGGGGTVLVPAGTIMVSGNGKWGIFDFLAPDGTVRYPPPPGMPAQVNALAALCRTSDGHIAGPTVEAPGGTAGIAVLKASDLTLLSTYIPSRSGSSGSFAADGAGHWYLCGGQTGGGGPVAFTRLDAAGAVTGTWDIDVGGELAGLPFPVIGLAVSADGLTAYTRIEHAPAPHVPGYIHVFDLAGTGTWLGPLNADYDDLGQPGVTMFVIPGGVDLIVALGELNGLGSGFSRYSRLRRYRPDGTLVWEAGTPAGVPADQLIWRHLAPGAPGDTHFLAWAHDQTLESDDDGPSLTYSECRYVWFDYATGTPDNSRNFTPEWSFLDEEGDLVEFDFDSAFAVLGEDIVDGSVPPSGPPCTTGSFPIDGPSVSLDSPEPPAARGILPRPPTARNTGAGRRHATRPNHR